MLAEMTKAAVIEFLLEQKSEWVTSSNAKKTMRDFDRAINGLRKGSVHAAMKVLRRIREHNETSANLRMARNLQAPQDVLELGENVIRAERTENIMIDGWLSELEKEHS